MYENIHEKYRILLPKITEQAFNVYLECLYSGGRDLEEILLEHADNKLPDSMEPGGEVEWAKAVSNLFLCQLWMSGYYLQDQKFMNKVMTTLIRRGGDIFAWGQLQSGFILLASCWKFLRAEAPLRMWLVDVIIARLDANTLSIEGPSLPWGVALELLRVCTAKGIVPGHGKLPTSADAGQYMYLEQPDVMTGGR